MLEVIDLSQEIFPGMPVFPGLPEVEITIHASHEQWDSITDSEIVSPAVNRLIGRTYRYERRCHQPYDTSVPWTVYRHDASNDVLYRGYLFRPVS